MRPALLLLAALAAPLAAAAAHPAALATPLPWFATLGLLCAAALLGTARDGADVRARYATVAACWGGGHLVACLLHTSGGGAHLPIAATGAGLLAGVALMQLQLRRRVAPGTVTWLVLDAGMLGVSLAVVTWHVLSATGATGPDIVTRLAAVGLLLCVTHVIARGVHAALGDTQLRPAGLVLVVCGAAELLLLHSALAGTAATGWAALLLLAAGVTGAAICAPRILDTPRTVCEATVAGRHRELASVVPWSILLADLVWLMVHPASADRALIALYALALVLYVARQVQATRAYAAVAADLRTQALLDRSTGLGNRLALTEALRAERSLLPRAVVLVDVEGVEYVNDVLGLGVGDEVLTAVAEQLGALSPRAGAYRLSGAGFALLLDGDTSDALALAPAALEAVRNAPARVPAARRFTLDATVGIACTTGAGAAHGAGTDPLTVLTDAGLALRGARAGGAGTVAAFDGAVAEAHRRRLKLRERLQIAIAEGSVEVHFQPVVDMSTGRVSSFEALARWSDPDLGRVSPVEFIAAAEEANLVVALGQHVLASAVRTAAGAGVFAAGAGLAVNVSVVQLHSPGFPDVVRAVLADAGAPAHLLTLEVTESVFLDPDSPAERVLTEIAALGVRIAIDDFGAGHSSFGYLGRLPAHVLKIDRSLTNTVTADADGRAIVSCIVDLATRLGMMVVVEGIETVVQAAICRRLGAQRGQGWLFEAAVPADRLAEQLPRTFSTGGALTSTEEVLA